MARKATGSSGSGDPMRDAWGPAGPPQAFGTRIAIPGTEEAPYAPPGGYAAPPPPPAPAAPLPPPPGALPPPPPPGALPPAPPGAYPPGTAPDVPAYAPPPPAPAAFRPPAPGSVGGPADRYPTPTPAAPMASPGGPPPSPFAPPGGYPSAAPSPVAPPAGYAQPAYAATPTMAQPEQRQWGASATPMAAPPETPSWLATPPPAEPLGSAGWGAGPQQAGWMPAPGARTAGAPSTESKRLKRKSGAPGKAAYLIVMVTVIALAAFGGFKFVSKTFFNRLAEPPPNFAGQPKLTGAFATNAEDITNMMEKNGASHAVAAVYGQALTPSYLLAAGTGGGNRDSEAVFRDSITGTSDTPIQIGGPESKVVGARTYVCATVNITSLRGGFCTWSTKKSQGMLVAFQQADLEAVAKLTDEARVAIKG